MLLRGNLKTIGLLDKCIKGRRGSVPVAVFKMFSPPGDNKLSHWNVTIRCMYTKYPCCWEYLLHCRIWQPSQNCSMDDTWNIQYTLYILVLQSEISINNTYVFVLVLTLLLGVTGNYEIIRISVWWVRYILWI